MAGNILVGELKRPVYSKYPTHEKYSNEIRLLKYNSCEQANTIRNSKVVIHI